MSDTELLLKIQKQLDFMVKREQDRMRREVKEHVEEKQFAYDIQNIVTYQLAPMLTKLVPEGQVVPPMLDALSCYLKKLKLSSEKRYMKACEELEEVNHVLELATDENIDHMELSDQKDDDTDADVEDADREFGMALVKFACALNMHFHKDKLSNAGSDLDPTSDEMPIDSPKLNEK